MISDRVQRMIEAGISYPLAKSSEEKKDEQEKLCSNENPLGASPKAVEVIKEHAGDIGEYPESHAIRLKEAIGEYIGVSPTQVCVGNGSDEIMDLICKATMDPGDKALIPIPTFSQYELASRINAVKPKFVELEDFRWDPDRLIEEMNDVKAAFIGRPNNPTGNSIDEAGLRKLIGTGKVIIVDEAYGEFSDYSVVDWTNDYDNLIVLRTFSKIFGLAGLRVGYGVANNELTMALERVRAPFSVNRLAQRAAIEALKDKEFIEKSKKIVREGRDYLKRNLEDLGFEVRPTDANFLMVGLSQLNLKAPEVRNYLSQEGFLIRDLSDFRGAGPEWIRITVGKPGQNKRLISSLREFLRDRE